MSSSTVAIIAAIVVVVVVVVVIIENNNRETFAPTASPTTLPTLPPTIHPLYQILANRLDPSELDALNTPGSSQDLAFQWLVLDSHNNTPLLVSQERTILQRYVLAVLYFSTNYGITTPEGEDGWLNETNWLSSMSSSIDDDVDDVVNECTWFGIVCSGAAVVGINLRSNRLSGTLPSELQHLESLDVLQVSDNSISHVGNETDRFAKYTSLSAFLAGGNFIEYDNGIPPSLFRLTNLVALDLSNNLLSGEGFSLFLLITTITTTWLEQLQVLDLHGNALTGTLSTQISRLESLQLLDLSQNAFMGTLPSVLLPRGLITFRVGRNLLSGSIPSRMIASVATALEVLDLRDNVLTGEIPTTISSLTALETLLLQGNQLSLDLSTWIQPGGGLFKLRTLVLDYNVIESFLPTEIANLASLEVLSLANTGISGTLPSEVGQLTSLRVLHVENNKLSGTIPTELGLLTNLESVRVFFNNLTGRMPFSVCDIDGLEDLIADCAGTNPIISCSCCTRCL